MNINNLMIRDIRATIECENGEIIIRNPKGEVKEELLLYFADQLERNIENASKKRGRKKKTANEVETFKVLMDKLTNINIDVEIDVIHEILNNPSYEMTMVMLYLSSIQHELTFELLASQNLNFRMEQNVLLEKDTLNRIADLENVIKEIKHRKLIENGKEV